jgi:hypothetical protein
MTDQKDHSTPRRVPLLPRIKCLLGRHAWVSDAVVLPDPPASPVTLIWWTCEECWETKIKYICR